MTDAELDKVIASLDAALRDYMGQPRKLQGEARIKADEVSARLKELLDERTRRKLEGRWSN